MTVIKSISVGQGDMYYILHNSDNFTIIDCMLPADTSTRAQIVDEIIEVSKSKTITRFISTHPDQDHVAGLQYLDSRMNLRNFYCIANNATKDNPTPDFEHYCTLRDNPEVAYFIYKNCIRRWMNTASEARGSSGINILWPNTSNIHYQNALDVAENAGSPNNTSAIIKYQLSGGVTAIWMGDLETSFMELIEDDVTLPKVDILFAPHHGRLSGRVPSSWLAKLDPELIILGEAPPEYMYYYPGWNTITQNTAGDITLDCRENWVDVYVGSSTYAVDFLIDLGKQSPLGNYIGSL